MGEHLNGTIGSQPNRHGSTPEPSFIRTWLPLVLVVLAMAVLSVRQLRPITDPDVWWHLRLGHQFRESWQLSDPVALTPLATETWVPTQWATQVLASYANQQWGLAGVVWLTGLAVCLLGATLWYGNRLRAAPIAALLATVAALAGTGAVLAPRPQVASLVFLSVFATAWWLTSNDGRARWWLIPLTWVWANMHGFWFLGPLVGIVVLAGMLLDRRLRRQSGQLLVTIPIGGIALAALTPVGPRLLQAPFKVYGVREFIQEWQPPSFTEPTTVVVLAMAAVVIATFARRGGAAWSDLAVLAFACVLLVYAERTVALAAVLLSPLVAASISMWLPIAASPMSRQEKLGLLSGVVAVVVLTTAAAGLRGPYEPPFSSAIDESLARLPAGTVVYNAYEYGGWMSWRHPDLVHGVDGLTESFDRAYLRDYLAAGHLLSGWDTLLDKRVGAGVALIPAWQPLASALVSDRGWVEAADDGYYVLLRSPDSSDSEQAPN